MATRSVQCRLPCELSRHGQTTRGIALTLSESGLFVQSRSALDVGETLLLRILSGPVWPEARVEARVTHVKKVHPSAQVVVARGMSLEVIAPGDDWQRLTIALGCSEAPLPAAPEPVDEAHGLPRFRVVLRCKDDVRIRTRVVRVACVDPAAARSGVEEDLEDGWEIVKIEREPETGGAPAVLQSFRVVALSEGGRRRWEARVDARTPLEARHDAEQDLPPTWRLESVERVDAGATPVRRPAPRPTLPGEMRWFQVKARHLDGNCIRTRMLRVRAVDADDASSRVLAQLGDGWEIEKIREL